MWCAFFVFFARRRAPRGRAGLWDYEAWDQYGDESKFYAPYVKECMYCPTNYDDVRKSFDHPHKCHHDKHRKHGILVHDDDVPMPLEE